MKSMIALLGMLFCVEPLDASASPVAGQGSQQAALDSSAEDLFQQGLALLNRRQYEQAIKKFDAAIAKDDKLAIAYDRRGDAWLLSGEPKKAIADFDIYVKFQPAADPHHWRRGIAYYYARDFKAGVAQFERHKKVNPDDVENAFWHYLCNVHVAGQEAARAQLINVTGDGRVPMKEVMQLLAGKATPDDVLKRAEAELPADSSMGVSARFYAHLYLALWAETNKDPKLCREHLELAVKKYKSAGYMWEVAHMHLQQLKQADATK